MGSFKWTREDDDTMRRLYPCTDTKWLAGYLGRTIDSLYGRADRLGLNKDPLYLLIQNISLGVKLKDSGKGTQFRKGHASWNKGRKGYCVPGSEKGWFKKGHLPQNTKFDGAISLRYCHSGHRKEKKRGYYYIRLSKANWKELHVYLWEQQYGPVPKGMNVVFKDGNSLNCIIENLELITRQEHMARSRNSDEYIAMRIANKGTKGKGQYNRKIYDLAFGNKALLEVQRRQFQLNRLIKESR